MRSTLLLLSLCSLFLSCSHLKADRGPERFFNVSWAKDRDPSDAVSGNLPIALNSPFAYEGMLYAGHNEGRMVAYELETGREIWSQEDKSAYHSAPIVYKDQIIYGTVEGRVYSRQYLNGKLKYVVDLGSSIETEPVVHNGRVFFHLRNHQIFALDVETGKILWAYKRSVPSQTTLQRVSRPLVVGSKLYVGFADGYVAAFGVEDGVLLWENKIVSGSKFVDVDSSPLLKDGKLFVGSLSGPLAILEPNTGNLLRNLEYVVGRAPMIKGENMLLGTGDGSLVLLDRNYNEIRKKKISSAGISSIVEWKGLLAVSTTGPNIYLLDPVSFEVKETFDLGHSYSAVFGQLQSLEGKLAVLSSRNRIYVFK